jgi:hypothetical protein
MSDNVTSREAKIFFEAVESVLGSDSGLCEERFTEGYSYASKPLPYYTDDIVTELVGHIDRYTHEYPGENLDNLPASFVLGAAAHIARYREISDR